MSRLAPAIGLGLIAFSALTAQTPEPPDARDNIYYPGDTENAVPLGKKLFRNVLLDQKAIWTSPFHADRTEALEWLGFTAITASLVVTDRRTTHIFENSHGQIVGANAASHLGATYTIAPEVVGFYLYGVLADNQKARETGVLGGEALIDTSIVVEVLKTVSRRSRPNATSHPGDFFKGGASFPSGHTIASFALATVIAREYSDRKWVPFVAYGLASVVGGARFAARQHYASDIFAGAALGYFIGRYVEDTHQAHAGHRHGMIQPIAQPSTRTFGAWISFGN